MIIKSPITSYNFSHITQWWSLSSKYKWHNEATLILLTKLCRWLSDENNLEILLAPFQWRNLPPTPQSCQWQNRLQQQSPILMAVTTLPSNSLLITSTSSLEVQGPDCSMTGSVMKWQESTKEFPIGIINVPILSRIVYISQ